MTHRLRALGGWMLGWLLLSAAGAAWLAHAQLEALQAAFDTDGRIVHRILSQQVVQNDAVLATLALAGGEGAAGGEARLPAVYPSILRVQRRAPGEAWNDAALAQAEVRSRAQRGPVLADADLARGRYRLVIGAAPASFALDIDLAAAVPWRDWPADPKTAPARMALVHQGQRFELQGGRNAEAPGGWHFRFRKPLASASQPFEVDAERRVGWGELPWGRMLAWAAGMAVLLAGARLLRRQRTERRRAEELLRLGQVARLNTLGELAAGMAHELNQPLTAVLASTQAARRLLDEEPPETGAARDAMAQAALQARRAADVLGRLRGTLERPDAARREPVDLRQAARRALHLLEPEGERRHTAMRLEAPEQPVRALADPVALEQIVHNLLMNALQALEDVPPARREVLLRVRAQDGQALLSVSDTGPGIPAELRSRVFQPFFSTRSGGLGLGLSLSETLAAGMGGALAEGDAPGQGACFVLSLPLA